MAAQVIPAVAGDFILSMNYDPTGLELVAIFDNICLGWTADDAGAAPVAPVILGTLPPAAADTAPVLSPQWAHVNGNAVMVPDVWRGTGGDFLDWLSGNNGARRKIEAHLSSQVMAGAFESWKFRNPELAATAAPGAMVSPDTPPARGAAIDDRPDFDRGDIR